MNTREQLKKLLFAQLPDPRDRLSVGQLINGASAEQLYALRLAYTNLLAAAAKTRGTAIGGQ